MEVSDIGKVAYF